MSKSLWDFKESVRFQVELYDASTAQQCEQAVSSSDTQDANESMSRAKEYLARKQATHALWDCIWKKLVEVWPRTCPHCNKNLDDKPTSEEPSDER